MLGFVILKGRFLRCEVELSLSVSEAMILMIGV